MFAAISPMKSEHQTFGLVMSLDIRASSQQQFGPTWAAFELKANADPGCCAISRAENQPASVPVNKEHLPGRCVRAVAATPGVFECRCLAGKSRASLRRLVLALAPCPEIARKGKRIDIAHFPPFAFIWTAMKFPVMARAERDGEFIAHLAPHGPWLGKTQMMGLCRFALADETGLSGNEFQMVG